MRLIWRKASIRAPKTVKFGFANWNVTKQNHRHVVHRTSEISEPSTLCSKIDYVSCSSFCAITVMPTHIIFLSIIIHIANNKLKAWSAPRLRERNRALREETETKEPRSQKSTRQTAVRAYGTARRERGCYWTPLQTWSMQMTKERSMQMMTAHWCQNMLSGRTESRCYGLSIQAGDSA